jgi:hypothetical protein
MLDFGGYFLTLLFIANSHYTLHDVFTMSAMHVPDSGGILYFPFMSSDCTNYVDPHTIITIFFMFWLYFMFLLIDGFVFSVFDSRY